LDRAGVGSAISADLTVELRAEIGRLAAAAWQPLAKADGTPGEPGRLWAEVPFVPDDPTARKGERPCRYLVIKLPSRERQGDFFDPPPPEYVALVTNRSGPGDALTHWHREKCGTIEHVHDWIKHDVGAEHFPCGAFGANAAWYRLALLALNVFQAVSARSWLRILWRCAWARASPWPDWPPRRVPPPRPTRRCPLFFREGTEARAPTCPSATLRPLPCVPV